MDELEKAQRQLEQAKTRVQKIKNRERTKERKRDTRRKIILGAILLAEARRDPATAGRVRQWIDGLPEKDRAAFDGCNLEGDA
ncbi:MAG: mobilization protein [Alphaproteobacteria bacterium]|nr:mobilization protein [Alphaproteobacteria bacterium]